jgi:hypothetical protein
MATLVPVQLGNSGVDPRGRRYTSEEREHAYLTWRVVGRRSLAATAELMGIAENTVRAWAREDGWRDRSDRDDADAAELARQSLATLATSEVVRSLEVVTQLRDDPATPAKTRLDAAVYVLGLWGVAPPKAGEVALRPAERSDRSDRRLPAPLLRTLTPDQITLAERAVRGGEWGPLFAALSDRQLALLERAETDGG